MQDEHIQEMLEKLKSGELSEYIVTKDEFLNVRNVIVKREDFKHFRGIAKRGGSVLYQYLETARS
ncbi:hypothetical protein F7731_06800 [Cytobacillus depressus]|uniref:Abortive phage infection protein n=1 Tax=Cytobacillus depressus TaxID=1602942 RepID=A0A6L3V791_9BACI|nr:hypothetical protein [Cytobacillus depressus]KAB2337317.1 hypothetical protein F7731_06800 [Cytobacillus depressus]